MTHGTRNSFELYRLLVLGVLEERLKSNSYFPSYSSSNSVTANLNLLIPALGTMTSIISDLAIHQKQPHKLWHCEVFIHALISRNSKVSCCSSAQSHSRGLWMSQALSTQPAQGPCGSRWLGTEQPVTAESLGSACSHRVCQQPPASWEWGEPSTGSFKSSQRQPQPSFPQPALQQLL